MKIISCNGNLPLSLAIAQYLNVDLLQVSIQRFADQEICIDIQDNVRGQDVFVIQPTSSPANDTLMELLVMIDALKRSGARTITAVIPYYGYGRQDRRIFTNSSIPAKLVGNLLTTAGVNHILTIDWHSPQTGGFFDIPIDNLTLAPLFYEHIQNRYPQEPIMVVSPDVGGLVRARALAEHLSVNMAIIDKRRSSSGNPTMNLIGNVKNKICILVDDIVDSGKTLYRAAEILKEAGALAIDAYASHGVLSGDALDKLDQSPLDKLIISDTIQASSVILKMPKIEILTIAPFLAESMKKIVLDRIPSNEQKKTFEVSS